MKTQSTCSLLLCVLLFVSKIIFAQNVGINIPNPQGKLHIKGSADISQLVVEANGVQNNYNPLILLRNANGLLGIHSDHNTNAFFGLQAGRANNAVGGGLANTFIGSDAGLWNTTGSSNTALGRYVLTANTTGLENTAAGYGALAANETGTRNTANGTYSLFNSDGNYNTAYGSHSLYLNTVGGFNTAVGAMAIYSNATGIRNTAIGSGSLYSNVAGSNATVIGYDAMRYSNNTASAFFNYNVAVGYEALRGPVTPSTNTGNQNTAIGYQTLYSNTTGSYNTSIGLQAMFNNTTGAFNAATGFNALGNNTTGNNNIAHGHLALVSNVAGSNATAIGAYAMRYANNTSNPYDNNNVAVGFEALRGSTTPANNSGINNTALGYQSLRSITTGNQNSANGYHSLYQNTTGNFNTAVGNEALSDNTDGNQNSGFGYLAGVGSSSLTNATAIGAKAQVDADHSIVLGSIFGVNSATNSVNVGIGTTSPQVRLHVAGGGDANYNPTSGFLVLGNTSAGNVVFDNNEILSRNNGLAAPLYLQASGGNIKIGNAVPPTYLLELATNSAGKPGSNTWDVVSDRRVKKDIEPFNDGLNVVKQVNPVWFRYNGEGGITDTSRFAGIIAQEIQKIAPYMINTLKQSNQEGIQTEYLKYDGNAMTYILLNAIKEQQKMIEELKMEIDAIRKK